MSITLNEIKYSKTLSVLAPSIILGVFFLSEFASKILRFNNFEFNRISGVIKLIVEFVLLYYLIRHKKQHFKSLLKIVIPLLAAYIIGQLCLNTGDLYNRIILNFYSFNGYILIFILY